MVIPTAEKKDVDLEAWKVAKKDCDVDEQMEERMVLW